MARRIDITGQKFGRLTAVEYVNTTKPSKYRCICECGNETFVACCGLRSGNTQSCGCLQTDNNRARFRKPKGLAGARQAFNACRNGANSRGHEFALTFEQFQEMTVLPCFYCGAADSKLVGRKVTTESFEHSAYKCNGLDRVENDRGYVLDNVVPCCARCNYAKRTYEQADFVAWIERAYLHLKEKKA